MKKIVMFAIVVFVLVIGGVFVVTHFGVQSPTTQAPKPVESATPFSLAQIQEHATSANCYMAISGKVYDLSPYLQQGLHPGGNRMVPYCGMDATDAFNGRGNGRGNHMHSYMAQQLLASYQVGILTK